MSLLFKNFFNQKRTQSGFTILELIVVIAIFLVITGVVLTDIPNFRNKSSIDLTAGEIATYIRAVQNYAVSRKMTTYENQNFFPDYQAVVDSQKFLIYASSSDFSDTTPVESYEMVGYNFTLFGGNSFSELSSINSAVAINFAGSQYTVANYSDLTPVFFTKNPSSLAPSNSDTPISANIICIKITSIKDSISRCVFVFKNGQITLSPCPEGSPVALPSP